jgi:hypothetical protein
MSRPCILSVTSERRVSVGRIVGALSLCLRAMPWPGLLDLHRLAVRLGELSFLTMGDVASGGTGGLNQP